NGSVPPFLAMFSASKVINCCEARECGGKVNEDGKIERPGAAQVLPVGNGHSYHLPVCRRQCAVWPVAVGGRGFYLQPVAARKLVFNLVCVEMQRNGVFTVEPFSEHVLRI